MVLLLADVARAVVHRYADARFPGRVRAAAVPETPVPDEHRALGHLGRDRVVVAAVVGAAVGQVRPGNETRGAVRLGEVGQGPHRVAHRRRVRLGNRDELVVGVDRLGGLAGEDVDRRERRDQATGIEHPLHDREHVIVHGNALPEVVVGEQVVDPERSLALERVRRRLHVEGPFEA